MEIKFKSAPSIEPEEINIRVDTFEKALEYLGRENKACISGIPDKHAKVLIAIYKLITIAEAWNKADNFVPDFSNRKQRKYFPWFVYNDKIAGLMFSFTYSAALSSSVLFGSWFCFKTEEHAEQFGDQFIDLWNDFLLN